MDLRARVRGRVPAATALLSLVSLGLVFGAAGGVVPAALLPRAPATAVAAIPHVNAAVSVVALGTVLAGVRAIRRGAVDRHRRLMLLTAALFAVFLALYLYKVALVGTAPFPGPAAVYRLVYLPVLAVHVLLAVVCVSLVYYVLLLAYVTPVGRLPETRHPRVGRVAAALWATSFALGVVVYALLYLVY